MAKKTIAELKAKFKNGDKPTEDDFSDVFDSIVHKDDPSSSSIAIADATQVASGDPSVAISARDSKLEIAKVDTKLTTKETELIDLIKSRKRSDKYVIQNPKFDTWYEIEFEGLMEINFSGAHIITDFLIYGSSGYQWNKTHLRVIAFQNYNSSIYAEFGFVTSSGSKDRRLLLRLKNKGTFAAATTNELQLAPISSKHTPVIKEYVARTSSSSHGADGNIGLIGQITEPREKIYERNTSTLTFDYNSKNKEHDLWSTHGVIKIDPNHPVETGDYIRYINRKSTPIKVDIYHHTTNSTFDVIPSSVKTYNSTTKYVWLLPNETLTLQCNLRSGSISRFHMTLSKPTVIGGDIDSTGTIESRMGRSQTSGSNIFTVSKTSTGQYVITHNLGHTDYIINALSESRGFGISSDSKQSNSIRVKVFDTSGTQDYFDRDFQFLITSFRN